MKIRSLLGNRDASATPTNLNFEDLAAISNAEIDLLRSIDFNMDFDLPFSHLDKVKQNLMTEIPNPAFISVCNSIIIDVCLMICSAYYLDVPPEVAAAAATVECVNNELIPRETSEWIEAVRIKYGDHVFDLARMSIARERQRTARPPDAQR
jgi:hypothetical protein